MTVKLGIGVKKAKHIVTIVSLLGSLILVNKIYKRCPLKVQGEIFLVELMDLPFNEFDPILRMDWLVEHHVHLDCALKRVNLVTENEKKIL